MALGGGAILLGGKGLYAHAITANGKGWHVDLTGGDAAFFSWGYIVVGAAFTILAIAGLVSRAKGGQG